MGRRPRRRRRGWLGVWAPGFDPWRLGWSACFVLAPRALLSPRTGRRSGARAVEASAGGAMGSRWGGGGGRAGRAGRAPSRGVLACGCACACAGEEPALACVGCACAPVLAAAPRRLSALASRYAVALRRTAGGPSRLLQYMSCAHRAEALARATCASRVRLRFARTTFHACTRAALVCAPHAVRWVCPCVCVHSAAGDSLRDPLACARALCGTCAVRLCAVCSCCVCLCCALSRDAGAWSWHTCVQGRST